MTSLASMASSSSSVSGRTPEAPCARLASFSAIISRATATGIGSPTPAAWLSTMLRCRVSRSAAVDAHAGQLPEAGVDAVDRLAVRHDARHGLGAAATSGLQAGSSTGTAPR